MATSAVEECVGRFFRYIEAGYSGKTGKLVISRELRPLKSISCPGCPECESLDAELAARVNETGFIQFNPALESGDTVMLLQIPVSRNQETGELLKWYYEAERAQKAKESK